MDESKVDPKGSIQYTILLKEQYSILLNCVNVEEEEKPSILFAKYNIVKRGNSYIPETRVSERMIGKRSLRERLVFGY
ncbi:hypothetical protein O3M35_001059 [Rhynocoris fuscipes]|uniref:Uncharacterized protein n=1 Tax=Rhynocoris fuscipes TaxID=488301 RepID=A0AAW1DQW8_9HEMI